MSAISSLSSIAKMAFGTNPVTASLVPLSSDGYELGSMERGFQYFPETITSTRGANWVSKQIPGGSHPLYQFISGTDHAISFSAVFTADEKPAGNLLDILTKGFSLASAVGSLFGVAPKHTSDVGAAIAWLRSFTLASYQDQGAMKAPPVLRLYLPNSGINGWKGSTITPDSIDVIMTQCDVTYESFHRNGFPRIAVVQLSFFETIQVGQSWKFVDRLDWDDRTKWKDNYKRGKGSNAGLGGPGN